jgi:hypothetical protein
MAKFQFSISQTVTMDTNDWPQRGRDQLAIELVKLGWRRDNGMVPTAAMLDDAMRVMVDQDRALLEHIRHDMSRLESKDIKIVCIDREFEPGTQLLEPDNDPARIAKETAMKLKQKEEADRVKASQSGTSEMAKLVQQPDEGAKNTVAQQASARHDTVNPNPLAAGKGDAASTAKEQPKNSPPVSPAPKIEDQKAGPIQGARDSTQKK